MEWAKKRITGHLWQATTAEFRITETGYDAYNAQLEPYRLDAPGASPQFFATLEAAKRAAALQNELNLIREENARLREQLATVQGRWPALPACGPDDVDRREEELSAWQAADADLDETDRHKLDDLREDAMRDGLIPNYNGTMTAQDDEGRGIPLHVGPLNGRAAGPNEIPF